MDPNTWNPDPDPVFQVNQKTSKLQGKPSALKREHPALQKKKFNNFLQLLWDFFALMDPDPGAPLNPDPVRIHNTDFWLPETIFLLLFKRPYKMDLYRTQCKYFYPDAVKMD